MAIAMPMQNLLEKWECVEKSRIRQSAIHLQIPKVLLSKNYLPINHLLVLIA
jgi:hypothetical protein